MENLQSLIDERLVKENSESTRKPIVSPSQLGKCIRSLMLMERGFEAKPFEPILLRTFRMGYLVEAFALDTLEKTGKLIKRQQEVEYRGIKGTLDSIINMNNENILFDVKSVKTDKFKYLDTEGVDESYKYQLSFYHRGVKDLKLSNMGRILYIEKDNLMVKEMPVDCVGFYPQVEKKIDEIESARKSKDLPPEPDVIDWRCFSTSKKFKKCKIWCQYFSHCPHANEAYNKQVAVFGGAK